MEHAASCIYTVKTRKIIPLHPLAPLGARYTIHLSADSHVQFQHSIKPNVPVATGLPFALTL